MKRRAILLFVLASLVLGASLPLAANYKRSFKAGILEGLDRENWGVLAAFMRDAIDDRPQESSKKIRIYGNRVLPYLPHFYLGQALYELGDHQGALREWETSQQHGALTALKKSDRSLMETRLTGLRLQLAGKAPGTATEAAEPNAEAPATTDTQSFDELLVAARESVAAAEAVASEVGRLAADPILQPVWGSDAQLGPEATAARDRFLRAKHAAETAESFKDKSIMAAAQIEAEGARGDLTAVRDHALSRKQALIVASAAPAGPTAEETQLATARADVVQELERAEQTKSTVEELARDENLATIWSGDERLGGRESKADGMLEQSRSLLEQGTDQGDLDKLRKARNLASEARRELAAIARLAPSLQGATQVATREDEDLQIPEDQKASASVAAVEQVAPPEVVATVGPPPELLAAAEAYFGADYDRAANLLAEAAFIDPKIALQAHLFRAAARYALFVVGGELEASLEEDSLADIRALIEIEPDFAPQARAFSPRFRRFFAASVAGL